MELSNFEQEFLDIFSSKDYDLIYKKFSDLEEKQFQVYFMLLKFIQLRSITGNKDTILRAAKFLEKQLESEKFEPSFDFTIVLFEVAMKDSFWDLEVILLLSISHCVKSAPFSQLYKLFTEYFYQFGRKREKCIRILPSILINAKPDLLDLYIERIAECLYSHFIDKVESEQCPPSFADIASIFHIISLTLNRGGRAFRFFLPRIKNWISKSLEIVAPFYPFGLPVLVSQMISDPDITKSTFWYMQTEIVTFHASLLKFGDEKLKSMYLNNFGQKFFEKALEMFDPAFGKIMKPRFNLVLYDYFAVSMDYPWQLWHKKTFGEKLMGLICCSTPDLTQKPQIEFYYMFVLGKMINVYIRSDKDDEICDKIAIGSPEGSKLFPSSNSTYAWMTLLRKAISANFIDLKEVLLNFSSTILTSSSSTLAYYRALLGFRTLSTYIKDDPTMMKYCNFEHIISNFLFSSDRILQIWASGLFCVFAFYKNSQSFINPFLSRKVCLQILQENILDTQNNVLAFVNIKSFIFYEPFALVAIEYFDQFSEKVFLLSGPISSSSPRPLLIPFAEFFKNNHTNLVNFVNLSFFESLISKSIHQEQWLLVGHHLYLDFIVFSLTLATIYRENTKIIEDCFDYFFASFLSVEYYKVMGIINDELQKFETSVLDSFIAIRGLGYKSEAWKNNNFFQMALSFVNGTKFIPGLRKEGAKFLIQFMDVEKNIENSDQIIMELREKFSLSTSN
jgi:hypothetical protein